MGTPRPDDRHGNRGPARPRVHHWSGRERTDHAHVGVRLVREQAITALLDDALHDPRVPAVIHDRHVRARQHAVPGQPRRHGVNAGEPAREALRVITTTLANSYNAKSIATLVGWLVLDF